MTVVVYQYMRVQTRASRIKRRLEKEEWYLLRHGSGHGIYRHPRISGIITLPRHRTLSPAVARSIARKARLIPLGGLQTCPDIPL